MKYFLFRAWWANTSIIFDSWLLWIYLFLFLLREVSEYLHLESLSTQNCSIVLQNTLSTAVSWPHQGCYLCLLSLLLSEGANHTKNQIRLNWNHSLIETSSMCWGKEGKDGPIDHNSHIHSHPSLEYPQICQASHQPGELIHQQCPSADPWKNRNQHFINILKPHMMEWQHITVGKILFFFKSLSEIILFVFAPLDYFLVIHPTNTTCDFEKKSYCEIWKIQSRRPLKLFVKSEKYYFSVATVISS